MVITVHPVPIHHSYAFSLEKGFLFAFITAQPDSCKLIILPKNVYHKGSFTGANTYIRKIKNKNKFIHTLFPYTQKTAHHFYTHPTGFLKIR